MVNLCNHSDYKQKKREQQYIFTLQEEKREGMKDRKKGRKEEIDYARACGRLFPTSWVSLFLIPFLRPNIVSIWFPFY